MRRHEYDGVQLWPSSKLVAAETDGGACFSLVQQAPTMASWLILEKSHMGKTPHSVREAFLFKLSDYE